MLSLVCLTGIIFIMQDANLCCYMDIVKSEMKMMDVICLWFKMASLNVMVNRLGSMFVIDLGLRNLGTMNVIIMKLRFWFEMYTCFFGLMVIHEALCLI